MSPSLLCNDGDAPSDRRQSTIDCKLLQLKDDIKEKVSKDNIIKSFNMR